MSYSETEWKSYSARRNARRAAIPAGVSGTTADVGRPLAAETLAALPRGAVVTVEGPTGAVAALTHHGAGYFTSESASAAGILATRARDLAHLTVRRVWTPPSTLRAAA